MTTPAFLRSMLCAAALLLALQGCGFKGPLYLPGDEAAGEKPAPGAQKK